MSLDANVLVYALHTEDRRHARAVEVVGRAARGDCVQTMQSFGECFNALVRKRGFAPAAARDEVQRFQRSLDYAAPRPCDLDDAMRVVVAHRLSFWDAMLWAVAKRVGCAAILTEDMQDHRDLEGVRIIDPFKPENAGLIDAVLSLQEE